VDTLATISDLQVFPLTDAGSRQILLAETGCGQHVSSPAYLAARRAARLKDVPTVNAMPQAIVSNWTSIFRAGLSVPLYSRIMQISLRQDGWRGPGSKGLTPEALKVWLDFWTATKDDASEPALALTARGTIQAEWFRNSRSHLDLEFVSKDKIFFGLFDGRATYEGVDTLRAIIPWLSDHRARPLQWRSA
jgi:hypothetical protein